MEPRLGLPGTNATNYFCPQLLGHKFCPGTKSPVSGGRRLGFRNDSTFLLQSGVKLWLGLLDLKPDCCWDLLWPFRNHLSYFHPTPQLSNGSSASQVCSSDTVFEKRGQASTWGHWEDLGLPEGPGVVS